MPGLDKSRASSVSKLLAHEELQIEMGQYIYELHVISPIAGTDKIVSKVRHPDRLPTKCAEHLNHSFDVNCGACARLLPSTFLDIMATISFSNMGGL